MGGRRVTLWFLLLSAVVSLAAGCGEGAGTDHSTLSSAVSTTAATPTSVATPPADAQQAVEAAVAWVKGGTTQVRTCLVPAPASDAPAADGLFIYTYGPGGLVGRMESVRELYEPIVAFPVVWEGDTYYLNGSGFDIAGAAQPGLAVDLEGVAAGLVSAVKVWGDIASYTGTAFALLRVQDPLRLLEAFTPGDPALPAAQNGQVTIQGKALEADLVASPALEQAMDLQVDATTRSQFLPEELSISLVLSTTDWRPLELRLTRPPFETVTGPETVSMLWDRASAPPNVPEGYVPLLDYMLPAANPSALLSQASAWLAQSPVLVSYPQGSALLDATQDLFAVSDLPGSGGWGGAFPDESEAGSLVKGGSLYLWLAADSGTQWVSADEQQLQDAFETALVVNTTYIVKERRSVLAYRAILRRFLLDWLDPSFWIAQLSADAPHANDGISSPIAVSATEGGFRVIATFRDDQVFPALDMHTPLTVALAGPPASIAEQAASGPWNYTQEFTVILETDSDGVPVALTLSTNAPAGFAALQSLRMTFERIAETVPRPEPGLTLPRLLSGS
jgi:hypothetical protein